MSTSCYMAWILSSLLLLSARRGSSLSLLASGRPNHRVFTSFTKRATRGGSLPRSSATRTMSLSSTTATHNDLNTVVDFCRSAKQRIRDANSSCDVNPAAVPHIFLGNEAGDADSILSAIGLSYVRALQAAANTKNDETFLLPLVSIPADNLKSQRPETAYLLSNCAGMTNLKEPNNHLVAIDETDLLPTQATVTLMDHNFCKLNHDQWIVTEIVDHHLDEGKHSDHVVPEKRRIAFEDSKALVASTTTLVAEEFYDSLETNMPPSLAILLLGTILLDSVNMSPKAGKGTDRDAAMIKKILEDTNWTQIRLPNEILAQDGVSPDPEKLFRQLQDAKFSPEFWNGLTAEQAIRMDFKSFAIPSSSSSSSSEPSSIGIASILLEQNHFYEFHSETIFETMAKVIEEDQSELLGSMFSTFGETKRRQLALASYDKARLDHLVEYLTVDPTTTPDLELAVMHREEKSVDGKTLYLVRMEQVNVVASRKQVAPILMEYFQNERSGQ